MSAEFVDALKGYEYYLKERGEATIDDVNHYLVTHGRTPIQLRTYGHYRKLLAHGFRSYIPINQFDVFQAIGKLQMAADRRRYHRDKTQIPAKISRDGENWKDAVIVDKSLVGFGVTVVEKFAVSMNSIVWIRFDDYDDIPVILVWKRHDQDGNCTNFGARAFEFIANYRLTEEDQSFSRLTGILQISREEEGILEWEHIYRVLDKNNQLLDAASELLYTLGEALESKVSIARPVLKSIKFGSPGELQTKVDFGVAEIVRVLIETIQFWALNRKRVIEENRKLELENVNLSFEIARKAINLRKEAREAGMTDDAIAVLLNPIKTVFNRTSLPKSLFEDGTPERGILTERVIPAIAELVAGDDPDFKISVYKVAKSKSDMAPRRKRRNTHHA
ncbi:MAG TPA: PilZ domain-containing protein [Anaerolineales bacterium]|nr:PilZ domain-containing protein [Anaerolineales bacterium]